MFTMSLSFKFFLFGSTLAVSSFLGSSQVLAQLAASQVITLTTGSEGQVTTRRMFRDETQEQVFGFSQTSSEDQTEERTPRRRNRQGQSIQERNQNQVSASSFILEQGTRNRVERVTLFDRFDYSEATFNQSFELSY